jgi:hypothetical protein
MRHSRKLQRGFRTMVGMTVIVATMFGGSTARTIAATNVKPYIVGLGNPYEIAPVLSVADQVPETSNPAARYQMIGIPDGLGAYRQDDDTVAVFMNHELTTGTQSEPVVGGPLNRGALVSKYLIDEDGDVLSGERAYDTVYQENVLVGPAADTTNTTPAFGRFCSGSMAGSEVGFDRPIFLTGEEVEGAAGFDGKGGQTVAIFDNQAHALPRLGRFSKENTLVMPDTGNRTVALPLEDGPSGPDSQLYLYVGKKNHQPGATVLSRNGLDNGTLYVFRSTTAGKNSELPFESGTIQGEWVEIPDAGAMTDVELEAASDSVGAFGFVRIEDGAFDKSHKDRFFFVTTGGNKAAGNELGRLYQLQLNPGDPTRPAQLRVVYNADQIVAAGGDIAISPDNIDTSKDSLVINEDGTAQSRLVMAARGRDGSIWEFDLRDGNSLNQVDVSSARRVAELDPPGRDGVQVGPGVWETSGIIDVSGLFGQGIAWLTVVQAHSPTTAPAPNTVEDGQLLLLRDTVD